MSSHMSLCGPQEWKVYIPGFILYICCDKRVCINCLFLYSYCCEFDTLFTVHIQYYSVFVEPELAFPYHADKDKSSFIIFYVIIECFYIFLS